MSYCQWCDGGPECPNSINAKNHSDYVSGLKAENARLKEQVGRLSGVSKEVRRLWGTGDLCPYRGVDNDGDWSTVARAMDSFNAALSGTDGEAWLNEEQMKGAVGWKPIGTAPKDRWIDGLYEEGPETIRWSDDRACMLGRRAGAYPPGWEDEENHLPVDSPIAWREAKALRSKGGERAT